MEINNTLKKWLEQLEKFEFQSYEKLPDIDLYMDQMITYLERQLAIFATSSMDKQITSSMINNYVKGEVISAPILKKYNREHLALIEEVCTLKQVLSLSEIKEVIKNRYNNESNISVFNNFKTSFSEENKNAVNYTLDKLHDIKSNDIEGLSNLALDLTLKSVAYITIAKRILFLEKLFADQIKEKQNKKES